MIHVVQGSLLEVEVEAVVRPVRADLSPVSSASRDLATRAGPRVEEHLARLGSLPLGGAVMTPAGALPSDFIIHAVVMSQDEPTTFATVQKAVQNSLRRATDWEVASLALPPLGIGVGTTEPEVAAQALLEILFNHVAEGAPPLELTVVVTSQFEEDLFTRIIDEITADREGAL